MQRTQPGGRPVRRRHLAILPIAFLGLGGCTISEGLLELFASDPKNQPLCGVLFAWGEYRDRDQGRRDNDGINTTSSPSDSGSASPSSPETNSPGE